MDPKHSVLVVWDVQNALVNGIFNKDHFIGSLKKLLSEARSHKVPVIYTKITPLPFEFESGYRLYSSMKRYGISDPKKISFMKPGSPEAEIYAEVAPVEGDTVINKNTADIFVGTNVELMLHNARIDTVIFTGIATEFGVESSARSAGNRGFYPVVVEDCVSSSSEEMHSAALKVMRTQVIVAKSDEIIQAWK
ncbi:N-carbamoylsarcosine amidase related protein [Thermoplasma acidophilum]|uniref:N-carbamoylsarcosine amidase related protein n=1 Tax=Thermoplasma acidophilum (strain ATCC 25905 / DSM 1728 / JCM 9062 / NBRC 15155 / AMRC-C165) TaxID=273075 RepID=Q9HJB7_THEAC|nr:N-carbamoylsarcosine amidase related protein [Thermoplasma acidophilum]